MNQIERWIEEENFSEVLWSHLPIVSTVIRLVYLLIPAILLLLLVESRYSVDFRWIWVYWPLFLAWAVGLGLSDAAHWLVDGCPIRR